MYISCMYSMPNIIPVCFGSLASLWPGENLTQELRNIAKATPPNRTAWHLRIPQGRCRGERRGAKLQGSRDLVVRNPWCVLEGWM